MKQFKKISNQEVEVAQKNLEGFILRLNDTDILDIYPHEKNYAKKKDLRICALIFSASKLFEDISKDEIEEIKTGLSSLAINILIYCDSFHVKVKEVAKYSEYEQTQYSHIDLEPAAFMVYVFKEIIDIKFNYWSAHHAGESLGKCFSIANHYKIDLWQQIDNHILNLQKTTVWKK